MTKGEPWLATPEPIFSNAHPRITALDLEFNFSAFGHYSRLGHNPTRITVANARAHYGCPNPQCKGGGLDFDSLLRNYSLGASGAVELDDRFPCAGYEVKRTGKNIGRDCDNYFHVKGAITLTD